MNSFKTSATATANAMATARKRYMNPQEVWGYSWGFEVLNRATGGVQYEPTNELTVVGARSGVGKSAFGMEVSIKMAIQFMQKHPGKEVRIILLEMTAEACTNRLLSQLSGVNSREIQSGIGMDAEKLARLEKASLALAKLPLRYMEGAHNMENIRYFIELKAKDGMECGFYMLDHIGIVPTESAKKSGNTTFALGEVSRELHEITRRNCPGVVLAQLNRQSLGRRDPTPGPADLYGADAIYHNADVVMFLHRPEILVQKAEDEKLDEEVAYVLLDKQREGPSKLKLPVLYTPRLVQWSDLPQGYLEGNVA